AHMTARWLLTCLVLLMPVAEAPAGNQDKAVGFRDDFATDSRKDYTVQGDVTWQKGRLTLAEGARLERKFAVGHTVEVRAVLRLPPGADEACLALTLSGGGERVRLELARVEGKVRLRQRVSRPLQEVALDGPGPWALRWQVRWGLVQVK